MAVAPFPGSSSSELLNLRGFDRIADSNPSVFSPPSPPSLHCAAAAAVKLDGADAAEFGFGFEFEAAFGGFVVAAFLLNEKQIFLESFGRSKGNEPPTASTTPSPTASVSIFGDFCPFSSTSVRSVVATVGAAADSADCSAVKLPAVDVVVVVVVAEDEVVAAAVTVGTVEAIGTVIRGGGC